MSNFSEAESTVFKNEEVLSTEYLPELLPCREGEVEQLKDNLLPASKGRMPQNTFLFGPPGIGKTATVKFVFREFEEFSEKVKTVYLNCWDYKTANAIFSKITLDLSSFSLRAMSKDEVIEKFAEACNKTRKGIVVCLDEVDQLEQEALYDLLRINQYVKNPFGIVFISNNPYVFAEADSRIRSSLNIDEVEFKAYTLDEMKNILQKRVEQAFRSVEQGVVLLAANHAIKNGGDVRIGLECLLKAGRNAEKENSDRVEVKHVKEVLAKIGPVKPKILEEKVGEVEKIILEIVKEKKKLFSGELYDFYCKKVEAPISERAFRDYVNHLAEINLIKIVERKRGVKGKRRTISLA